MRKIYLFIFVLLCGIFSAQISRGQTLSGIKTIDPLGSGQNNYTSLSAAIADLNTNGVGNGGVTFNIVASFTETAPIGGYKIIATGTQTNQIIFNGNGAVITASNALNVGDLNDGIIKIVGSDWLTLSNFVLKENAANTVTTAASNNMTEWGIAILYATTTNGSKNITLQNNTITLDRTYQNTFGIYANSRHAETAPTTAADIVSNAGSADSLRIYSNNISNVNIGIAVVGSTSGVLMAKGLDIGGSGPSTGNTISNYGTTGTFSSYPSVSSTVNGIYVNNNLNFNIAYNSITSSNGGVTAGTLRGIFSEASGTLVTTGTYNNVIKNNTISLKSGLNAGAMLGIANSLGNATVSINISNNDFNNITHNTLSGTPSGAITFISNTAAAQNITISSNTFTNISVNTTGSVIFITSDVTMPANGTETINNNSIVTSFAKSAAGGTVSLYTASNSSSPATATYTASGNNFSNITVTGATTIAGWLNAEGAGVSKVITNNTFNNWTGGSSAITGISINYSGTNTTVSNNTITNFNSGGAITGINIGSSNNPILLTVASNTISNLSTTSGNITGINNAATTAININNNNVHTFNTGGASSVITGIISSGGLTVNINANKVHSFVATGATASSIGLSITGGTTLNVFNNMLYDYKATASSSTGVANQVIGASFTGSSSSNISFYFNTVLLNATSTGVNFGSSVINMNATPVSITLRNNLLINNTVPTGTGLAVVIRKSSTSLANYSSSSNNNILYAGTPSAQNLIFHDGTNSDQVFSAFKTRVSPRESYSASYNQDFINTGSTPYDVHINASIATPIESGAIPISGITTDIDGDLRHANFPDIGADEGAFIISDIFPPVISFTPVPNTALLSNKTVSGISITDASGVNITSSKARMYYRKKSNTDNVYISNTNATAGWKYVESTSTSSPFSFTIDYSLLNAPVAYGDSIQYVIVAQDNNSTANVILSSGTPNTVATSVDLSTNFPINGNINYYSIVTPIPASVTVGTGGTYPSLTGAGGLFAAINASVLGQNVTATVISNTTETGANALNQFTEDGVGNYSLNIIPASATNYVLSGNFAGGLITLNGADRVTIDGSFAGSGQYLTFQNDNTSTSAVFYLKSLGANAGASNNTIKNCNILSGLSGTTNFGIYAAGLTISTSGTGADHDQLKIQNNIISRAYYGIYISGTDASKHDGLMVIDNEVGSTISADYIRYCGIWIQNANQAKIVRNKVHHVYTVASTSALGVMLSTGVVNSRLSRNNIYSIRYVATTDYGTNAIVLNTGVTNSLDTVDNNIVGDIGNSADNLITNPTYGCAGIQLRGTTAGASTGGVLVAHNSVVLNGNFPGTLYTSISAALHVQSAVTNIKVVNNIFVNRINKGAVASRAYSVLSQAPPSAFTILNNNLYWYPAPQSRAGYINGNEYPTLATFSAATLKDSNSYNENPMFVDDSIDLHINAGNTPTLLESKAISISGINTDIDGHNRPGPVGSVNGGATAPDIGADEFDGVPNVGDVVNPIFVLDSINPPVNTCLAVAHNFYATITDASGIDSAIILWTRNGIPQTPILMTNTTGNKFEGSIPSNLDSSIAYSFRIVDASVNHNAINVSGGIYLDQSFTPSPVALPTSINQGGTVQLEARVPGKVSIGLGASTTSGTVYPNPFNPYYGGSRHQFLVLATELTAAGVRPGNITSIAFDPIGANSLSQTNIGFTISLGLTSESQLTNTFIDTNLVQVTNPVTYHVSSAGFANNTFTFSTPFNWDGVSNIVVNTCYSNANSGGGSVFGGQVTYTTTGFTSASYYRADGQSVSTMCGATTATGISANRPNMLFGSAKTVGIGTYSYAWSSTVNGGLSATNIQMPTATPTGGAGTYKYFLTTGNGTCNYTDSVSVIVSVPVVPVADFTSNVVVATTGGTTTSVNFSDISTNIPDNWSWKFSPNTVSFINGTTSSSQNPTVQFNAAGLYTVKLIASNSAGSDSIIKIDFITVTLDYCTPSYSSGAGFGSSGGDYISSVVLGVLNNASGATPNPPYANYTGSSTLSVPDLVGGSKDTLTLLAGSYSGGSEAFGAWIDYNQNGIFELTEKLGEVSSLPAVAFAQAKIPFQVPINATPGLTRMRVREAWGTTNFDPCVNYSYGEAEDYSVNIIAAPAMSYVYSTTEQNTQPSPPASTNQVVIGMKVVTAGYTNPLVASKFVLSSTGTTNISDITSAKIYYTGNSKTFAATNLFGTTSPSATFTINGNQVLSNDTNYFWLTYDLSAGAVLGNVIDASFDTVVLSSVGIVPSVTSPAGNKTIGAFMTTISSSAVQANAIPVFAGSDNNAILRVEVNMSSGVPVNATKLRFTALGTSNLLANTENAKLYFTGSNNVFSVNNQFGSTQNTLLDTFEFNGNAVLAQGINYFWLSYGVPSTAMVGDSLDASFEDIIVNSIKNSATVANPNGNRKIAQAYCESAAALFTSSDEEDIGNVTITDQFGLQVLNNGVAIPANNNPTAVNIYTDYRNIIPPVVLAKIIDHKIVVRPIWTGSKYAENIHVYIDINRNGVFTDPGEKVAFGTVTVGMDSLVSYFNIPSSASVGYTVMRVIDIWSGTTFPGPCGDYSYGETEDYLIKISPPPPGDYYPPDISNIVLSPDSQCTAVSHTISATITDTTAVDSAWVLWSSGGVAQLPLLMSNTGNTYSATIPSQGNNVVSFAIRAIDVAANNNEITTSMDTYQDDYFRVNTGVDKYVAVGQTASLSANTTLDKPFKITEFNLFNTSGGTNGSNTTWPGYLPTNMYDDNVEITNLSSAHASLSGYTFVTEGMATNHHFTFPAGTMVPPQGVVILHFGTGITDPVNLLFSTGSGSLPSSGASIGLVLLDNFGNVKDAVATNNYSFSVTNGVTTSDWSGSGVPSPSGGAGATLQGADNNSNSNWVTATNSSSPVSIGFLNPNLPILASNSVITWTGGVLTAPVVGSTITTPVHPNQGVYTYYASSTNGVCNHTDTILVNVLGNPIVDLGPDGAICGSVARILDAGNVGSTYLWSTGETTQSIAVSSPGTYIVTVTNQVNLSSSDSIILSSAPALVLNLGADRELCTGATITLDGGAGYASYNWSTGATTQTIQVNAIGTYSLTVTNTSGCIVSDTLNVVPVIVVPTVNLGADQSVCSNSSIILDAGNAGSTYLWSTGATTQSIKVTAAGTYFVHVTNTLGCTRSDTIVITNKPQPNATFTTSIILGDVQFTAISQPGHTYSWDFGDGGTSALVDPIHTYTAVGQYTVKLTVTNLASGCIEVGTQVVNITSVGLNNVKPEEFNFKVYPNPFAENTTISYELHSQSNVNVEVYDVLGRKVKDIVANESQEYGVHKYILEGVEPGVYMVRLNINGKHSVLKITNLTTR